MESNQFILIIFLNFSTSQRNKLYSLSISSDSTELSKFKKVFCFFSKRFHILKVLFDLTSLPPEVMYSLSLVTTILLTEVV